MRWERKTETDKIGEKDSAKVLGLRVKVKASLPITVGGVLPVSVSVFGI